MKTIIAMLAVAALSGCLDNGIDPLEPQVSDFNGHSVSIIYHRSAVGNAAASPIVIKANEICGTVGKKAIFGSIRPYGQFQGEHTYLCV